MLLHEQPQIKLTFQISVGSELGMLNTAWPMVALVQWDGNSGEIALEGNLTSAVKLTPD